MVRLLTFRNRLNGNWEQTSWHLERLMTLDDLNRPVTQSSLNISYRQKQRKMFLGFTEREGRWDESKRNDRQRPRTEKWNMINEFLRTSHASVIGNLSSKRERKSIKQKWVVFLRQRFRSSALPTQIRRRKTKARMRICWINGWDRTCFAKNKISIGIGHRSLVYAVQHHKQDST